MEVERITAKVGGREEGVPLALRTTSFLRPEEGLCCNTGSAQVVATQPFIVGVGITLTTGAPPLKPEDCKKNEGLAVPLQTFSGHKLSDQLPILIPSFELATHQVLLGNAHHVMPLDLLAEPNEFETTQPPIYEGVPTNVSG